MLLRVVCVAYLSLLLVGCAAPIPQLDVTPEQMSGIDRLIGENFLTFHADIEPILGEAQKTIENDTPTYDYGDKYRFRGLTAGILNDKVVMLSFYANRRLTPHEAIYALGYRELPEYSWIDGRPVYMLNTENGKRIFFVVQQSGWTFVRIFSNVLDVKKHFNLQITAFPYPSFYFSESN
ncbi:hypothetical protein F4X33_18655 [Candidatus Poribacteria bacterium]|nr:hypothetical protein [Candidatus Poribacteria bacterium]